MTSLMDDEDLDLSVVVERIRSTRNLHHAYHTLTESWKEHRKRKNKSRS
jgi:hypothetical protein